MARRIGTVTAKTRATRAAGRILAWIMVTALLPCAPPANAQAEPPALTRRADGPWDASVPAAGTILRYTLDGTEPTRDSGAWLASVDVPPGYVLKVRAFTDDGTAAGDVALRETPLPDGTVRTPTSLVPVTQNRDWRVYDWKDRHAAAVALMRERRPEIVMLGDSITHFWGGDPVGGRRNGAAEWDRFFAGRRVVNLGYGWDRTENVLWRLTHGEFDDVSPAVVVVLIGTNNIGLNTADDIAAGVEAICSTIHARSPQTRILLLGLLPRGERPNPARDSVGEVNRRLATLDGRHGITYLDIGSVFVSADGTIAREVMYDFLHPTAKGYDLWAAAMTETLERLLPAQTMPAR
ncbi:GDSL-like Lipase/Acylhydrolase [Luteitalea pratensis]|uniref:GDSL-like Lipase/Acylhydrolase n=1 Tax=Luteitalea pratensis TaxID=1855912 RepID=A0A143PW50_LUTPR|nr:GDSL-like Lipase/Acylhydrolase [Luteitalea pratensis]